MEHKDILKKADDLYSELPENVKKNFGSAAKRASLRAAIAIQTDEWLQEMFYDK